MLVGFLTGRLLMRGVLLWHGGYWRWVEKKLCNSHLPFLRERRESGSKV
jgi:hypothetical protein